MSEKLFCPSCGIHFDTEFDDTLNPECQLWKAYNAEEFADADKLLLWEWWFRAPGNYLANKYNKWLAVQLGAFINAPAADGHGNQWPKVCKRWDKMNEQERREYQKAYHRWRIEVQKRDGGTDVFLAKAFDRAYRLTKFIERVKNAPKKWRKVKLMKPEGEVSIDAFAAAIKNYNDVKEKRKVDERMVVKPIENDSIPLPDTGDSLTDLAIYNAERSAKAHEETRALAETIWGRKKSKRTNYKTPASGATKSSGGVGNLRKHKNLKKRGL